MIEYENRMLGNLGNVAHPFFIQAHIKHVHLAVRDKVKRDYIFVIKRMVIHGIFVPPPRNIRGSETIHAVGVVEEDDW
jgi:hypothetical protein